MHMKSTDLTVLIGDDSVLARKQLRDIVAKSLPDATFIEASNGLEAVERYKEKAADLVFLDIVMPKQDGIGATQDIIALNKDALVVIVSSVGTKDQLKAAIDAGAKDFIQKPIREDQVESVIESHLKGE